MEPLYAIPICLLGLAFGSFLNVCIYRVPRALLNEGDEASMWRVFVASLRSVNDPPRSFCPRCKHPIRWYDNTPVVSWLVLRGRCRDCAAPIAFRYTAVELLTAVLFLACYARFGLSVEALKYCVFAFLLIDLIFTDAETKLLPDLFTMTGLAAGLIFSVVVPTSHDESWLLSHLLFPSMSARSASLVSSLAGAAVGAAFIFGSGMVYKLARGVEGMGFGDVKLMAMVGAFLGVRLTVLTIFGASLVGAVFGLAMVPIVWMKRTRRRIRRNREAPAVARHRAWESAKKVYRYYAMPFGVFLGTVAILALFFGDALLQWYWSRYVA